MTFLYTAIALLSTVSMVLASPGGNATSDVELHWRAMAKMKQPRWIHAAAAASGKIIVMGGSWPMDRTAAVYDTSSKKHAWVPTSKNMAKARNWLAAAALDTVVYAIGGFGDTGSKPVVIL